MSRVEYSSPKHASIFVIGAGPAGIAAATKLLENNFENITILEAENRIGGRVHSVKFGEGFVDLGAQFCHGERDNIVHHLVKDLDLLKHSLTKIDLLLSNGNKLGEKLQSALLSFENPLDSGNSYKATPELCDKLESVGKCFDHRFDVLLNETTDEANIKVLQEAKLWLANYRCTFDSSFDLYDLMLKSDYRKCEGDLLLAWNSQGFKAILDVMMKNTIQVQENILLRKKVVSVKNWKDEDRVQIVLQDGEIFSADHVIFTASVGVLKAHHEKLFHPPLPIDKVDAIRGIGFGSTVKMILKFSEPLGTFDIVGTIWRAEDLEEAEEKGFGWLQYLNRIVFSKNDPKIVTCWYAGENVIDIEKLPEDNVLRGQKYWIAKFLNPHFGELHLEDFIRSTWYSNPHFRGAYSYESVHGYAKYGNNNFQETLGKSLLNKNGKPTLLFAGEATHPYYFSTVHGAIETGYEKAEEIINYYKNL